MAKDPEPLILSYATPVQRPRRFRFFFHLFLSALCVSVMMVISLATVIVVERASISAQIDNTGTDLLAVLSGLLAFGVQLFFILLYLKA